jgi:hypothetical protein
MGFLAWVVVVGIGLWIIEKTFFDRSDDQGNLSSVRVSREDEQWSNSRNFHSKF